MNHIYIYSPKTTNRLKYVCDFIFSEFLKQNHTILNNIEDFNTKDGIKINYSEKVFENCINIFPNDILFNKETNFDFPTVYGERNDIEIYTSNEEKYFSFDIFAAVFFMISRIEEYNANTKDKFGRFDYFSAFSVKHSFNFYPIVDIWIYKLKTKIEEFYNIKLKTCRQFTFLPTIDIDNAYAYKNKGFVRTFAAQIKSILNLNFSEFKLRHEVINQKKTDPYDTFDFIFDIHKKYDLNPIFFFLIGKYGKNDKNISHKNEELRRLIRNISKNHELGLHPSFGSNKNANLIKEEKQNLEIIIEKNIDKSRQHFLMLKIPETYNKLISLNIKYDYTMGYAYNAGFRAGTCTPFYFYDIKNEKATVLKIVPFNVMDTTFKNYLKIDTEKSYLIISELIENIKKVDGLFVSLWHNETFAYNKNGFEWQELYKKMILKTLE